MIDEKKNLSKIIFFYKFLEFKIFETFLMKGDSRYETYSDKLYLEIEYFLNI